jgi:hypothetical protein
VNQCKPLVLGGKQKANKFLESLRAEGEVGLSKS